MDVVDDVVFFPNRLNNVFIIGKGAKAFVSLPRGKGVKLSIAEERDKRLAAKSHWLYYLFYNITFQ